MSVIEQMTDAVCGANCNPKDAVKMEYKGKTYCFCCPSCKAEFAKNPEKYLKAQVAKPAAKKG